MADEFDVIVVGARCAGAPLAALLSRAGLRVALVERARFPRDTLSTHIFQAPGINFLGRLGVLDQVRATGAGALCRVDFRQGAFATEVSAELRPGDVGVTMSVRRTLLDPILADAAATAGAEVMMGTTVTALQARAGRVGGVRVVTGGGERELSARLVVGADGRNSTVAKLVAARKYHVVPSGRLAYWGFFEGVPSEPDPAIVFHHWDGRIVIATPADSGLYQVIVLPETRFLADFRADRQRAFMDHATACAPVAARLGGARLTGKLLGMLRWESFFRESAGPGWALVGDAGHFKDPSPGQGITDAFRQAAALAPVIVRGLEGSDAHLDAAVREWSRWRDRDAFEHHWFACDLGSAGPQPTVLDGVMEALRARGDFGRVIDIFEHRAVPSEVVTPPLLLSTAVRMASRRGCDRRALGREVAQLVANDVRRKRLRRRPVFVDAAAHLDAGETEVPSEPQRVAA